MGALRALRGAFALAVFACAAEDGGGDLAERYDVGVIPITGGQACADCTIALAHVVSIDPTDEPLPRQLDSHLTRDARGRFYVAPTYVDGVFTVYGPDGRFLRTVGRFGSGPGELRYPQFVHRFGVDSLLVVDVGLGRGVVLDSGYAVARTFLYALPRARSIALRDDGIVVLPYAAERNGPPLQLMDWNGKPLQAFGVPLRVEGTVPFATTSDGGTWLVRPKEYVLEHYDRAGALTRVLRRDAAWFEPWTEDGIPRQPAVRSVAIGAEGILWTLVSRPVRGWKEPAPRVAPDGAHPLPISLTDLDAGYDFMIEAIDPAEGIVLASLEVAEGYFKEFMDEEHVYAMREDDAGVIQFDVFRFTLSR